MPASSIAKKNGSVTVTGADSKIVTNLPGVAVPPAPPLLTMAVSAPDGDDEPVLGLDDCDWLSDDDIDCIAFWVGEQWPGLEYPREDITLTPATVSMDDLHPAPITAYYEDGEAEEADRIDDLVDSYDAGCEMPPIILAENGPGDYNVLDGCHRLAAMGELDFAEVDVLIARPHPDACPPVDTTRVDEIVNQLADCGDDVWFASDNGEFDRDVTLAEMADPDIAGNNCFAASSAIWADLESDPDLEESGWTPLMIELGTKNPESAKDSGVHWAVLMKDRYGREIILDYTARQFDPDLPFPLVAPVDEWRGTILDRVRAKHGGELSSEYVVDGPGGRIMRCWNAGV